MGLWCRHLITIRPAQHSGELAALQGILAQGVVVDPHLGGTLAIAGFGADAVPAVPRDGVVRHLDAPRASEHYAAPAPRDVLLAVAVVKHAVLCGLAARPLQIS